MTPREWLVVAAFAGTVYAVSLISPEAAMLLGGFAALMTFVRGGIGDKILNGIKSVGTVRSG